jgi:hypothetical protein
MLFLTTFSKIAMLHVFLIRQNIYKTILEKRFSHIFSRFCESWFCVKKAKKWFL